MIKRFIEDDAGWIAYLNHQIDKELDKDPGEQNWDRIEEYQKALDEVCKGTYDPDPDIKEEKLNELRKLYHKTGKARGLRTKHPRWIPGAVAACLLVLILGIPVTSAAIYHISPSEVIRRWGEWLFDIPYNVPVEKEGITFVKNGKSIIYDTIEGLLESENVNILYPSWLPESVCINEIHVIEQENGKKVVISFNNADLSYIAMQSGYDINEMDSITKKDANIDGVQTDVIFLETNTGYETLFNYEDVQYIICGKSLDELDRILEGLRRR